MLDHYRIDKITCPWCAVVHDCASPASDEPGAPENGNINICINCECISVYDNTVPGGLRIPTDEEHTEAMQNPDVKKALVALRRSHYLIKKGSN